MSVFTFCQYCCSGLLETATIPLFLAVTAPHCVSCSNLTAPYRYYNGDDELGVLAQFYHIPWLSGRSLLWSLASERRGASQRAAVSYCRLYCHHSSGSIVLVYMPVLLTHASSHPAAR